MSEMIGVLPAAGRGSRLGAIPCSKEIMPLGFAASVSHGHKTWQPVTAIENHLRAFQQAEIRRVAIIVSDPKYDVVRYLGDGRRLGMSFAYFFQQHLSGMPFAIDLAGEWAGDADVMFAMPDTYIQPSDTVTKLAAHHRTQPADVSLALFRTNTPEKYGMVAVDSVGCPTAFVDKPRSTQLELMWGFAAWSPKFTRYLARYLASQERRDGECVLSDVFQAALTDGMSMNTFTFEVATYRDIGTPEDFQSVVYDLAVRGSQFTNP